MAFERIDKLKQEFTDQYVVVDEARPELARFGGQTGQVKTVNMSGRALVQFDAYENIGWYDIELDFLKVVPKPEPAEPAAKGKAAAKKKPAAGKQPAPAGKSDQKLSPLEMARKQGAAKKEGDKAKPAGATAEILEAARTARPSTADILEAARTGGSSATSTAPSPKAPATGKGRPKISTADILAAARGEAVAAAKTVEPAKEAPAAKAPAKEAAKKKAPAKDRSKMSVADMLAAARGEKSSSAEPAAQEAKSAAEKTAPAEEARPAEETAPAEEPAVDETPAAEAAAEPAQPSQAAPAGDLPTTTEEIIAYCRRVDAS